MNTRRTVRPSFSAEEFAGRARCAKLKIPADASRWDALETAAAIEYWHHDNPHDVEASRELRRRRQAEVRGERWKDDVLRTVQSSEEFYAHPVEPRWRVRLDENRYVWFPQVRMTHPDFENWQMRFGRLRKTEQDADEKKPRSPMTSRRTDRLVSASLKQWRMNFGTARVNAEYDEPTSPGSDPEERGKPVPAKAHLIDSSLEDWQMYLQPAPPNVNLSHPMFKDWLTYFGNMALSSGAPVSQMNVLTEGDNSRLHAKASASRKRKVRADDDVVSSVKTAPAARKKKQRKH
ncbi:hypothetical protein LTS18_000250 [Coniosporium uncinatum]|uniref:Uncharacterized protein n=1 Tax=Coniosporium uncinatum TaxID=93489 RepID=A0ACC3D8F0_9PEZI|nr:hypothetical protein LTS18_000250 [Coniosporium uncinatum]